MRPEVLNTPAERRRLKVREMILSAAERVFASEGPEGLSIRRLAEKIDYSPAAIYKYFESKDELVDELKEAFFARLLENVHKIADTSRAFPERARDCISTYVRLAIEKPHHYSAAFSGQHIPEATENADAAPQSNKAQAFAVLLGMVQEGIDTGFFRADLDASLTAKSVWASMHGLAMMVTHVPGFPDLDWETSAMSPDAFTDMHADLVMRGLEVQA